MREPFHILLVDDDEDVRDSLAAVLLARGYTVDTAMNGKEAYKKTGKRRYDLVISDIRMPKMDGFELQRNLRNQPLPPPCILMSGYDGSSDSGPSCEARAMQEGAYAFLPKPISPSDLLEEIDRLLGSYYHAPAAYAAGY